MQESDLEKTETGSRFEDFGLKPELLQAIAAMGFETPTAIQKLAIPHILKGEQDLIALAQTGTGKTAAFALPCLHKINPDIAEPQLLILSPTRELALQTAKEIKKFAKDLGALKSVALYGGADIGSQSRALSKGCQIVVGTPGRTLDFINQRRLDLSAISMVVLDEADEMLKMGFKDDLEAILTETPEENMVYLFSATMPKLIEKISQKYMRDSRKFSVGTQNSANKRIEHWYSVVHFDDRYLALKRWVDSLPEMYGIIFCRTRNETIEVANQLQKDGYPIDVINGDLNQELREKVMRRFHNQDLRILVATDVAARGLDVDNLTHVINFNLPDDLEVYIHRAGRTGRANNDGCAITLITPKELGRIRAVEKMAHQEFTQKPIPTGTEIVQLQLQTALAQLEDAHLSDEVFFPYMRMMQEKIERYGKEELAMKLLAVLGGAMLRHYQHAPDLNERVEKKKRRDRKEGQEGAEGNDNSRKRSDRNERSRDDRKSRKDRSERGERGDRGDRFERGDRKDRKDRQDRQDRPDRKEKRDRKERDHDKKSRRGRSNYTTCEVNVGSNDGLNPYRLMGLVNENFPGDKPDFGNITIKKKRCVFDIDSSSVEMLLASVNGSSFGQRKIAIKKL